MSGLAFASAPRPSLPMRFLIAALAWGAAAVTAWLASPQQSVWALFVGGMLIRIAYDAKISPPEIRNASTGKKLGPYADPELGDVPVNFLSDVDTTGGNSGSPVLDAEGKLIGLNFDSNWEAVSASWMFDPRYKRAIHVDMRYMRWLMAKVYPAPALLEEMGLPAR